MSEAEQLLESLPNNGLVQRERQQFALTRQALVGSPRAVSGSGVMPTITASSRGLKRISLTQHDLDSIARLPARVASQVKNLMERGWFNFARQELRAGRNPASKGWRKVLCDELLAGSATRAGVEMAFATKLGLSPGSARAQASVSIAVFAFGRIATEQMGFLVISPN